MRFLNKLTKNNLFNCIKDNIISEYLFIFILLFYVNLQYPSWFTIHPGRIDPFLYWGTAQNIDYYHQYFNETYYFRRWTLIYPIIFFQFFFEAGIAKFLLSNLNLFLTLLLILKISKNIYTEKLSGIFICVILCLEPNFLYSAQDPHSMYTSYPFFLTALYLISKFINNNEVFNFKKLSIISLILSLIIINNQAYSWLPISVFISLFFLDLHKSKKNIIKKIFLYGGSFLSGFIIMVIIDYFIGLILGFRWPNLIKSTYLVYRDLQSEGSEWKNNFTINIQLIKDAYVWINLLCLIVFYFFNIHKNEIKKNKFIFFLTILNTLTLFYYFSQPFLLDKTYVLDKHYPIFLYLLIPFSFPIFFLNINNRVKLFFYLLLIVVIFLNANLKPLLNDQLFLTILLILVTLILVFLKSKIIINKYLSFILFFFMAANLIIYQNQSKSFALAKSKTYEQSIKEINDLSDEVKYLTNIALVNHKRLAIVDDRPHLGWSSTISSLYGMYSAITLGYPPMPWDCKLVDWQLSFKNKLLIVIYTNKTVAESKKLLVNLIKHCNNVKIIPSKIKIKDSKTFEISEIN